MCFEQLAFPIHDIFHIYPHQYIHLAAPTIQTPATPLAPGVHASTTFSHQHPHLLVDPEPHSQKGQSWASNPGRLAC